MKTISLSVLLTVLTISGLFGQNADWWALDTVTSYDTNEGMGRVIYTSHNSLTSITLHQLFVDNQWKNNNRYLYTYNADGFMLSFVGQTWVNDHWEDLRYTLKTYDEQNNLLSSTTPSRRTLYQYNESGTRCLSILYQDWVDDHWENDDIYIYQYDVVNRLQSTLWQEWNNEQWIDRRLETYDYDERDNVIHQLTRQWFLNIEKEFKSQYFFSYNADNLQTENIQQSYNNDSNQWNNVTKETHLYDANKNLLEYRMFSASDSTWTEAYKDSYIYDSCNNLLTSTRESEIYGNTRRSYTYDRNNNLLLYLYQTWYANERWLSKDSITYTYDADNNKLSELSQYYENLIWYGEYYRTWQYDEHSNCTLFINQTWDLNTNTWVNSYFNYGVLYYNNMQSSATPYRGYKVVATYQASEKSGIVSSQNPAIAVYPNPARSHFIVTHADNAKLSLYNILGQKVKQITAEGDQVVIQTEHLPAGMYLLRIEKDKEVTVKKVQLVR